MVRAGTILVVDDEPKIVDIVRAYLERDGYRVLVAYDGQEALATTRRERPDLLVLDLMLPEVSGWDVCRRLRAETSLPIIMLTARDDTTDKIVGLELGADDYVAKPFEARELSLRITNILKRQQPTPAAPPPESLKFGDFIFHAGRGELRRGEEVVHLTDRERDMLRVLSASPGETVPRLALAGNGAASNERAVDVQVNRLRRKIEHDPAHPLIVQTVRGIGYRLVVSP